MVSEKVAIDPALLLTAYAQGIFPMGESATDPEVFWVRPEKRGVIPLESFHTPRSLAKTIRRQYFDIRFDTDFDGVLAGCANHSQRRRNTWINEPIRQAYNALFALGHCHTVEAWKNGRLAGGLYGVTLGRAFFGESMFSYEKDASKVCLAALVHHLRERGFQLLDTQFITDHLSRFGAIEIPRADYEKQLEKALESAISFLPREQA